MQHFSLTSACGITDFRMFSFLLPVSPNLYLILCWMSSIPELRLTPGWFSTEKRKQTNTKHYLLETTAQWGCVAGAKLQLSAQSPARHGRSQVAFGTGLPNTTVWVLHPWAPCLGFILAVNSSHPSCSSQGWLLRKETALPLPTHCLPLTKDNFMLLALLRVPDSWLSRNKLVPWKSPSGSGGTLEERYCRVFR